MHEYIYLWWQTSKILCLCIKCMSNAYSWISNQIYPLIHTKIHVCQCAYIQTFTNTCIHTYIIIYVFLHNYLYIQTSISFPIIHTYVDMDVFLHTSVNVCIYISCMHIYIHTYIHVHTYLCISVYINTPCIFAYINMYGHTYIETYIYIHGRLPA